MVSQAGSRTPTVAQSTATQEPASPFGTKSQQDDGSSADIPVSPHRAPSTNYPYWWMLFAAVNFAVMANLANDVSRHIPNHWPLITFARAFLVLLIMLVVCWIQKIQLVLFKPPILWMRSLAGSGSMVCTFYALTHLPAADAVTLTNTFPLWIVLISWLAIDGRPRPFEIAAVLLGMLGVVLILKPSFLVDWLLGPSDPILASKKTWLACGAGLSAALFTAIAMLGLHKIKRVDAFAVVVHFSAVATLVTLAVWSFRGPHDLTPLASPWIVASFFGIAISGTLGQIGLTNAYRSGRPALVSVVGLSQLVLAALVETLIRGKPTNLLSLIGMALVMSACAWIFAKRKGRA